MELLEAGSPVAEPHPTMNRIKTLIELSELWQLLDAENLEAIETPTPAPNPHGT
jgi:hypothetical protein